VPTDDASGIGISMTHEINAAIDRSLDWLTAQQKENGAWSNDQFPALTALPAWAFIRSAHTQRNQAVPKALEFLKTCVQPDGGIYRPVAGRVGGGLSNYNTAICMTTLHAANDLDLTRIILDARAFVAKGQHSGDDAPVKAKRAVSFISRGNPRRALPPMRRGESYSARMAV